jgi:MFS family permease
VEEAERTSIAREQARSIQALGSGGLLPIASTVIGETFPRERRGMALGFIGMVWGVAAIVGPLLGGWLTQGFGRQSIFYLNLPVALILLCFAGRVLPHDKGVHAEPLDVHGMIFLGAGLATLTYHPEGIGGSPSRGYYTAPGQAWMD